MTPKKHINRRTGIFARRILLFFAAGFLAVSCIYDFTPAGLKNNAGIIVIEGDIIAGSHSNFRISTTIGLTSDEKIQYITNAAVWIASESGEVINAGIDDSTGESFEANTAEIDPYKKYKLCVDIPGKGSYRTEYLPVLITKQIDSITYHIGANREYIQMEISAHDDNQENKYYKWNYTEDWEYRAQYVPFLKYNNTLDMAQTIPDEEYAKNYYCWNKDISTGIYIASTEKLSQNIVYKEHLNKIYNSDQRISYIYSIFVTQISLTKDAYTYWETLKKNTDNTGGIFAPQPSEMRGNIVSVTNPAEPVIGYISASTCSQSRVFLYGSDINIYKNPDKCQYDTIPHYDRNANLWKAADMAGMSMLDYLISPTTGEIIKSIVIWVKGRCADCRKNGGTKNKPSFWPNNHK